MSGWTGLLNLDKLFFEGIQIRIDIVQQSGWVEFHKKDGVTDKISIYFIAGIGILTPVYFWWQEAHSWYIVLGMAIMYWCFAYKLMTVMSSPGAAVFRKGTGVTWSWHSTSHQVREEDIESISLTRYMEYTDLNTPMYMVKLAMRVFDEDMVVFSMWEDTSRQQTITTRRVESALRRAGYTVLM